MRKILCHFSKKWSVSLATATMLKLLYAISSLESLDVIVLLLPTDAEALSLCRTLQASSSLLPLIHARQTSAPQLVVRVWQPSGVDDLEAEHLPSFELTPVASTAAVPNLLAEVLHPECHWTHDLDNDVRK